MCPCTCICVHAHIPVCVFQSRYYNMDHEKVGKDLKLEGKSKIHVTGRQWEGREPVRKRQALLERKAKATK